MTEVACGSCIGCRLEHSRQDAVRIMHEMESHQRNCFLTLTLDDDHLPEDGSLNVETFQLFMKRLRKRRSKDPLLPKIRFYHVGEYGDKFGRPHYHVCLFGEDWADDRYWVDDSDGNPIYRSAELEKDWQQGHAYINELTVQSAGYAARYITKKITGIKALEHYNGLKPEYATRSTNPGLGDAWIRKYHKEVYQHDSVIINGKEQKPPDYYDRVYKTINPEHLAEVKKCRTEYAEANSLNNTLDKLRIKKVIKTQQIKTLKRD